MHQFIDDIVLQEKFTQIRKKFAQISKTAKGKNVLDMDIIVFFILFEILVD